MRGRGRRAASESRCPRPSVPSRCAGIAPSRFAAARSSGSRLIGDASHGLASVLSTGLAQVMVDEAETSWRRCEDSRPSLRNHVCWDAKTGNGTGWGDQVRVVRVLGVLEPGGAQLSALTLSAALRRHGVATTLLAGDATRPGLELAARYGFAADAFRVGERGAAQPAVDPGARCSPSGLVPGSRPQTWSTRTWWGPGGLRHKRCHLEYRWWPANITRCPGLAAITQKRPGPRHTVSTCCSAMGRRCTHGQLG